jgi:hypothetical protein
MALLARHQLGAALARRHGAAGAVAAVPPRRLAPPRAALLLRQRSPAGAAPAASHAALPIRAGGRGPLRCRAQLAAAEPGKTTLGFVGIGIMGLAMVGPRRSP